MKYFLKSLKLWFEIQMEKGSISRTNHDMTIQCISFEEYQTDLNRGYQQLKKLRRERSIVNNELNIIFNQYPF